MAIMEYINDIKPDANLLPKDPLMKAKVWLITMFDSIFFVNKNVELIG